MSELSRKNGNQVDLSFHPLEKILGYEFKDLTLLRTAMTHKSFLNEYQGEEPIENNERFEFLGDAVLQFIISDILMEKFKNLTEGDLSKFRAVLVSEKGLAKVAEYIGLGKYLMLGKGEERSGGRFKSSLLADAMEALLAALYLDGRDEGIEHVYRLVKGLFAEEIRNSASTFAFEDRKTDLQELVQRLKLPMLEYRLLKTEGPDHSRIYEVGVYVDNEIFGIGSGTSKKTAEQQAAVIAYKKIKEKYEG